MSRYLLSKIYTAVNWTTGMRTCRLPNVNFNHFRSIPIVKRQGHWHTKSNDSIAFSNVLLKHKYKYNYSLKIKQCQ